MMVRKQTLSAEYFERIYRQSVDPWQFETSAYERGKYSATIDLLKKPVYRRALEVGCSIGVFTALLAGRCDSILAIDASQAALERARDQRAWTNVEFERRLVPAEFPAGRFDLIVLSEVLYYLSAADLAELARQCLSALLPGGEIILCHWLGETDYPLTGSAASDLFVEAVRSELPMREIANDKIYRLERLGE